MNVFPRYDNEATAIPCRTSKTLLKILTDLLGVLTASLNDHSLNVEVVNRVLDIINKYIEQSSAIQQPDTSKNFLDLQTQLNNVKTFSETGQLMRSTIDMMDKLKMNPMENYIPNANQQNCKDAFKKLVDTAQNAYNHISDFNNCESNTHSYAPISFYEHSLNVLPNKPIQEIPNEQHAEYLQNPQTNPGNMISMLEKYKSDNNKGVKIRYEQPFLGNNPISNPTGSASQAKIYWNPLTENSMTSFSQPNVSNMYQILKNDYFQRFPDQGSNNDLIKKPVSSTESRYNHQQPVYQPFADGNTPNLKINNGTYDPSLQYSTNEAQPKYIQKIKSVNFAQQPNYYQVPKESAFISPTAYKNAYLTGMNEVPPIQDDILHKLLQAMKLRNVSSISVPKTTQVVDITRNLPNNNVLTNIYPAMPNHVDESLEIPNVGSKVNLNNQFPTAYSIISPQVYPAEKFSYIPSYEYQVNILDPHQHSGTADIIVPNLPVGISNPNIPKTPTETIIPSIVENPTINPNILQKLPAFSQSQIKERYPDQNLTPGIGIHITLPENYKINQPTQSQINNNSNQSQREVTNFTAYGKTPNPNQISGVSNLKELNNVPSKTSIIELMYLLQQTVPIKISYVKYKIPYIVLSNILQQNSAQSQGKQELHRALASKSEIEVSPEVNFGSKDQIAQLLSTNGTFIRATILNDTGYSVKGLPLITPTESPQNEVLEILPLQRGDTRKQNPADDVKMEDLSKILSELQNLNSKLQLNNFVEHEDLTTRTEVGSKTEPTTYGTTTATTVS